MRKAAAISAPLGRAMATRSFPPRPLSRRQLNTYVSLVQEATIRQSTTLGRSQAQPSLGQRAAASINSATVDQECPLWVAVCSRNSGQIEAAWADPVIGSIHLVGLKQEPCG